MAIETDKGGGELVRRQLRFGTNVAVAVGLVIAICAVLQWAGYRFGVKADWTTSSVNSLSDGTENLLAGLDRDIRITSAYFENPLEQDDQKKFRQAVWDLADLYQIENRSKIEVDRFNPLQDHDKRQKLMERLAGKAKFAEQSSKHRELVEAFNNDILPQVTALLSAELETLDAQGEGLEGQGGYVIQQVQALLQRRQQEIQEIAEDVRAALEDDIPRYSAAVGALRSFYTSTTKLLQDIGTTGKQVAEGEAGRLAPWQVEFLGGAQARFQPVLDALAAQITTMSDLPQLELEKIVRELGPGSNALVVETDDDARVLGFADVWPPMDPGMGAVSMAFKDRAFKGEAKLSSAILQLTSDERTAVVFVKFGGPPLFFGGFMPGQPPAQYGRIKAHLEDLNFEVFEWDLSSQKEPPEIDPPAAKTIYVVFKPMSPPPNPMQRQQQPQFGPQERDAVLAALGESGRALFLAGWYPGPMGPMPGPYEYNQYLQDEWGISVESGVLLLQARPVGPGKFRLTRTSTLMLDPVYSEHPVVRSLSTMRSVFPYVAPLVLPADPPEGVTVSELVR
ncbi:MAG: Gldg family protein, partial [Phycisphaerae bacterium]